MANKVGLAKGTRDFNPQTMVQRNYITSVIKKHFRLFGYQQIQTPSFEKLDTLTGKYGEEGDRLIFKILNSGDYLKKVQEEDIQSKNLKAITPKISEKALRYDLTIPFARYVVQHKNELSMPFKRFQIQPVWRADRPQKGRYREFYQCDADVVGSKSLWQEVDLIQLYDGVFTDLNLPANIKINNRKILFAIAEVAGIPENFTALTVIVDKIDKIGLERVLAELKESLDADKAIAIFKDFPFKGSNNEKVNYLTPLLADSETGQKGLEELNFILKQSQGNLELTDLEFDVTLARGLDYYTGSIFEVQAKGIELGSIGGGGRYDDLTSVFGLKDISGVGISFGLDRIFLVLEELNLFPDLSADKLKILFINFGEEEAIYSMNIIRKLRKNNISADLYPDTSKMKKQMKYANDIQVPFIVMIGENEMAENKFKLKNMIDGTEKVLEIEELIDILK